MSDHKLDLKLQAWVDARKRHRLSNRHVQMARELGLNPQKLGKIDNSRQEMWKAPLPEFIERIYFKRFGKTDPDLVMSIEQVAEAQAKKKALQKQAKVERKAAGPSHSNSERPEGRDTCAD